MLLAPLIKDISDVIEFRPLSPDDMSDIRYVHSTAFRLQANAHLSQSEIQAFTDHVYSPAYGDKLFSENLQVAWMGDELIGTGGWSPVSDNGATARIRSIFVRPLFTGLGVGRLLVEKAEALARTAGFTQLTLRASVNSVGFFQALGYEVKSHGVRNIDAEQGLPVRFMRKTLSGDKPHTTHQGTEPCSPSDKADTASSTPGL